MHFSTTSYRCIYWGSRNPNNHVPLFKTAKRSWFLRQQPQPLPTGARAWNESVRPRALGRTGVRIRKHPNYFSPYWSWDCLFSPEINHGGFLPGQLLMAFFILKPNHCCLPSALEGEQHSTQTWALVPVRHLGSMFLSVICMGKAKSSDFPLYSYLTGKSLLTVSQIVSWKLDSFF